MAKKKKKGNKKLLGLLLGGAALGYYGYKQGWLDKLKGATSGNGGTGGAGVLASGSYSYVGGLGTSKCPDGSSGLYLGLNPWANVNFKTGQKVQINQAAGIGDISGQYTIKCPNNPNDPGRPANAGFTFNGVWNNAWSGVAGTERSSGTWQLLG